MEVKKLTDEQLVELVRSQDQELYQEVVRRYQAKLWRYAHWLVGDQERAADIVQEALIKAFVNLKGFNRKKKFSSWVYRIAHNEAINLLKKEKRKISLEKNEWTREIKSEGKTPEEELAKKEVQKMMRMSLKELPVNYREPLVLFYLEERSYEEISDILRMPIGTVGTRINRGKKMLKFICQKNGVKNGQS